MQHDWCPYKKRRHRDSHRGKMAMSKQRQRSSDSATSQGTPGATGSWKRQEGSPPGGFEGSLPCPHLDLGLWPRAVREYVLVSQAPQFVVLCYN